MPTLGANRYGKRGVRLIKVTRHHGRCDIKEVTANVFLEGDFENYFPAGDNRRILPTDTMKNTVYALARKSSLDSIEGFSLELVKHLLSNNPQAEQVRVELVEKFWSRIEAGGRHHPAAFHQQGPEARTTTVTGNGEQVSVSSGIDHLILLKT